MQKVKRSYYNLNVLFSTLWVALMIYLFYKIYSLWGVLIFEYQVIDYEEYDFSKPVFNELITLGIISVISGLGLILYLIKNNKTETVFIEKQKSVDDNVNIGDTNKTDNSEGLLAEINTLLNSGEPFYDSIEKVFNHIANRTEAAQGILYLLKSGVYQKAAGYALYDFDERKESFKSGEGITGEVARIKKTTSFKGLEHKLKVACGLGETSDFSLLIYPLIKQDEVIGIAELAYFQHPENSTIEVTEKVMNQWGSLYPEKNAGSVPKKEAAPEESKKSDKRDEADPKKTKVAEAEGEKKKSPVVKRKARPKKS